MKWLRRRRAEPPQREMPAARADAIKRALLEHAEWRQIERRSSPPRGLTALTPAAAVGPCLLAVGAILVVALRQPVVTLEAATGPHTALERLARTAHDGHNGSPEQPRLVSASRDEVVRWVQGQTGLSLSLADRRGHADEHAFVLEGAAVAEEGSLRAGIVEYRIDGRPVTLATAHEQYVPAAVRWSLATKRVHHRIDASTGTTILMWANSGQAYALVSTLPGAGERACLICHADGRRDAVIAALAR